MTWSSSHLAMGSMLLYLFSTKEFRKELKENPILFFILTLGAVIPDIDLFILSIPHRTVTHTFFLPLIMIIISPVFDYQSRFENLARNIRIFFIMWVSHILFDMSFGPIPVFYPLDTRFYDFKMGVIIDVVGSWFFGISISKFFIEPRFNPNFSSNTFYINWTSEERVRAFGGTTARINVTSLFIHLTIFIWYLKIVVSPTIHQMWNFFLGKHPVLIDKPKDEQLDDSKKLKTSSSPFVRINTRFVDILEIIFAKFCYLIFIIDNKLSGRSSNFTRKITKINHKTVTIALISLIYISYIGGPYYGETWTDTSIRNDQVKVLTDEMLTIGGRTYTTDDQMKLNLTITMPKSSLEYDAFVFATNASHSSFIRNSIQTLVNLFNSGNFTRDQFGINYTQFLLEEIDPASIYHFNENTSARWEFETANELSIVFGLFHWNTSTYFARSFKSFVTLTISRTEAYETGIMLVYIFSFLTFLMIIYEIYNLRNRNKIHLKT